MSKHQESISFHIMHSMKGGCGKSTCALFKALQLAHAATGESAEVLFLDADFKGSAMQLLLFREEQEAPEGVTSREEYFSEVKKKMSAPPTKGNGLRHTIAIPDRYHTENNLSQYLKNADIPYNKLVQRTFSYCADASKNPTDERFEFTMNGYIDFILASADRNSKDWFRNKYGKIGSGLFLYRMECLLNKILYQNATAPKYNDKSQKNPGQYKDVIIDMPPGYDEYSDMLLELLLKLAAKEERIKLHYYAVTTEDIGHIRLAIDNLHKVCTDRTEDKGFTTVNVIINIPYAAMTAGGQQGQMDFSLRIAKQIADWKSLLKKEKVDGKVYTNEYNNSYRAYCTIPEKRNFELDTSTLKDADDEEKL